MEEQRLQDQTDYWLVQYQRLMDKKPQALVDQVCIFIPRSLQLFCLQLHRNRSYPYKNCSVYVLVYFSLDLSLFQ